MNKIYFYDTGIRNMLIENFNPLEYRQDTGFLWENFLMAERIKKMAYTPIFGSIYFWRTYGGAELDFVEERDGKLFGYEFKWKSSKAKAPVSWVETYENASFQVINRDNFLEFIG